MTVFRVHTVEGRDGRDSWGVFVAERGDDGLSHERRIFGPANLRACQLERFHLISAERHGEEVHACS